MPSAHLRIVFHNILDPITYGIANNDNISIFSNKCYGTLGNT